MTRPVPSADELHMRAVEVLKALRTYHKSYRAAFSYPSRERLALLHVPTNLLAAAGDEKAVADQRRYADCVVGGRVVECGTAVEEKAEAILSIIR